MQLCMCCTVTRSPNDWMPPPSITLSHILGPHTIKDKAVIYSYNSSASSTAHLSANCLEVLASETLTGLSRRAATDDVEGGPCTPDCRSNGFSTCVITWTGFRITGYAI